MDGDLLTPAAAADLVGMHRTTITTAIAAGKLNALRLGGQWRVRREWLLRWLASPDSERTVPEAGVAHEDDRVVAYRERRLQALLRGATTVAAIAPEPESLTDDDDDDEGDDE